MVDSMLPFLNTRTPPPSGRHRSPEPAHISIALDPDLQTWVASDTSAGVAALLTLLSRYVPHSNVGIRVLGALASRGGGGTETGAASADVMIRLNTDLDTRDTFEALMVRTRRIWRDAAGGTADDGIACIAGEDLGSPVFCIDATPTGGWASLLVGTPLIVRAVTAANGVTVDIVYDATTAAEDPIKRFAEQWAQTLRSAWANPRTAIKDIETLPPGQKAQLLLQSSGDTVSIPNTTVIDLIEQQCAASPDRIAYLCDEEVLTYSDVNGKANGLARSLQNLGVTKGDVIPLLLDQSLDLIFSALALMKLGAVFVPLDMQWPHSRVERMLNELAPRIVLTNDHCRPSIASSHPSACVDASALPSSSSGPRNPVSPEDPIYGYYTSGSTGAPKCAINIHRGIVNRFLYMTKRYHADGSEVILQNSKHVFDAWVWQVFWPLTNGAKTVLPRSTRVFDLLGTIDLIARHRVTMTDFVPSVFNVLVEYVKTNPRAKHKLETLRHILIGGEELHPEASHAFKSLLPQVGLTNTYGPTETSIGTIFYELGSHRYRSVPIGRPIDNVKAVLLDEDHHLVPLGAIGEIHLGGLCVGRGYLNDPQRTKAVFVDNPYPELGCPTLYCTGDLAYYLPDGNIQFVGRRDQQVKLRGVRIELGEIESILLLHPEVGQTKVVVDRRVSGREELIAYIVGTRALVDLRAIKDHLRRELPAYMIPAHFVLLDAMPLDHNGKVDRKRLLADFAPEATSAIIDEPFEPRSSDEVALAQAWTEVFNVQRIGKDDDFFDLGGGSLHGVRMLCAIEKRTGITLGIHELYENRTIGKVAGLLQAARQRLPGVHPTAPRPPDIVNDVRAISVTGEDTQPNGAGMGLNHVLLTGATGFVGVHLLNELMTRTNASVYCLVRAHGEVGALLRLRESLRHYGLNGDAYLSRIVPLPGDLGRARFGLGEEQYREVARRVDTVIHSGALVDYLRDYAGHRSANVLGTAEVLRFAGSGPVKRVHHISTLGVLPLSETRLSGTCFREDDLPDEEYLPRDGYSQSKWVAERLAIKAREHGLPVSIYRLGEVMPTAASGIPNGKAFLHLVIKTFVTLGMAPHTEAVIDYVPADYVAGAVVHMAKQALWPGTTCNLRHPTGVPLASILSTFRSAGICLEDVSYNTFLECLDAASRAAAPDSTITLVRSLLAGASREAPTLTRDPLRQLFHTDCSRIDARHTEEALARSGIDIPADHHELARPYALYCKRLSLATTVRGTVTSTAA